MACPVGSYSDEGHPTDLPYDSLQAALCDIISQRASLGYFTKLRNPFVPLD